MNTTHTTDGPNATKVPHLDAWRGIFSVVVCFTHAWECFIYPFYEPFNWAHMLAGFAGRFAVLGFFIASGVAIAHNCTTLTKQHGHFPVFAYIQRRAERLAPPVLFSMGLCLLLEWGYNLLDLQATAQDFRLPRSELHYNLRMVWLGIASLGTMGDVTGSVNGPLWTFAIELGCYGLVGLIGALLSCLRRGKNLQAVIAVMLLLYFIYRALFPTEFFQLFAWIMFGSAFLINYNGYIAPARTASFLAVFFVVLAVLALIPGNWEKTLHEINHLSKSTLTQTLFSAGFMTWIFRRKPSNLLGFWSVLGRSSFTLYVIHFPLQFVTASYLLPKLADPKTWAILLCIVVTSMCVLLAHFLAPFVERRWHLRRSSIQMASAVER